MKFVINMLLGLLVTLALSSVSLASFQEDIDSGKDAFKRGQLELAAHYWEQARQHIPKNDPKYVDISVSLAAAYQKLGRLTKAFEVLESAQSQLGNINNQEERTVRHAKLLMHLSDVYVAMRDYEKERMDCGMKKISQQFDPFTREQLITKAENSLEKAEQEMAVIDPNQKYYPLIWANIFNRQGNLQWLTEKLLPKKDKNNKEETDKEEYPDYIKSSMKSIESASLFVPVKAMDSELVRGRKEAKDQGKGISPGYCGEVEQVLADKLIELKNNNTAVHKTTEAQVLIVKTLINCLRQTVLLEDINKINIDDFLNELQELYILSKVKELPDSHDKAFAFISLAQLMLTISSKIDDDKKQRDLHSRYVYHALTEAVILAGKLRNLRTMAYAKFYLAQFYEKTPFYQKTQRYQKAISLTRQALFSVHKYLQFPTELQRELWGNPELLYRFNWQLARLLKAQQSIEVRQETTPTASLTAIENAYKKAEKYLLQVRRHYGSFSKTLGNEFEQFYKEWAEFLLKQAAEESLVEEKQELLKQARDQIEKFQAQVVRNYFEDECITEWGEHITDIDGFLSDHPNTAIFYPVLFDDRIELLLSSSKGIISKQKLFDSQDELEEKIDIDDLNEEWVFLIDEFREKHKKAKEARKQGKPTSKILNLQIIEDSYNEFLNSLKKFYYLLFIKPIMAELKKQQIENLIIVPNGTLYKIPFAALYDGQQFLIDKYALSVAQGIKLTAEPPKHLSRQNIRALLAGADFQSLGTPSPNFRASGYEPNELPCASIELEDIACILRGFTSDTEVSKRAEHMLKSKNCKEFELDRKGEMCNLKGKVTAFKNKDFTFDHLKNELRLNHYSLIHIATHGEIGASDGSYLLGYDRKIAWVDLESLIDATKSKTTRKLDLLTLSACNTAAADEGEGKAVLGMAGMALRTGARNTLGSLWETIDTDATYIMLQFYQRWMTNNPELPLSKALQPAQLELKAQGGRYKHPYYWAPFLLIGNGW